MTVFGFYRFSLGPLVSKVKEHHVETIVDSLCSNMLSDNEQLRDISSIGESSCRFTWILMPFLLFGTSILFLLEEAAWPSGEHIVGPIIWWCRFQVSLLVATRWIHSQSCHIQIVGHYFIPTGMNLSLQTNLYQQLLFLFLFYFYVRFEDSYRRATTSFILTGSKYLPQNNWATH